MWNQYFRVSRSIKDLLKIIDLLNDKGVTLIPQKN